MKRSSILNTGVLCAALFLATMAAGFAASNLNSSRSNIYKLAPNDPDPEKTCVDAGGAVFTDQAGQKVCIQPAPVPAQATNLNSSRSNRINPNDPNGDKACTDGGGAVFTNKAGQKMCITPAPAGLAVSDEGAPGHKSIDPTK